METWTCLLVFSVVKRVWFSIRSASLQYNSRDRRRKRSPKARGLAQWKGFICICDVRKVCLVLFVKKPFITPNLFKCSFNEQPADRIFFTRYNRLPWQTLAGSPISMWSVCCWRGPWSSNPLERRSGMRLSMSLRSARNMENRGGDGGCIQWNRWQTDRLTVAYSTPTTVLLQLSRIWCQAFLISTLRCGL